MFIDDKLNHQHPIKVKKFPRFAITKTLTVKVITMKVSSNFIVSKEASNPTSAGSTPFLHRIRA